MPGVLWPEPEAQAKGVNVRAAFYLSHLICPTEKTAFLRLFPLLQSLPLFCSPCL